MKVWIFVVLLTLGIGVSYASDMALYIGLTKAWYDNATMLQDAQEIVEAVRGVLKDVKTFDDNQLDELEAWARANLDDEELDIIWVPGVMPSVLYPVENAEPDGSLAEEWLDNGNMFITSGDWFAYKTFDTGEKQLNNRGGAENILNLPGIIEASNDLAIKVTATGQKYMPSIGDCISDRPIQLNSVKDPWEVAALFGSPSGEENDPLGDPVAIHNTETHGYMVFINQARNVNAIDRAAAAIEFIKNWVSEIAGLSVESAGKLIAAWGKIRSQD